MKTTPKIALLIVDDHRLIIDGMVALLSHQEAIATVEGVTSAHDALEVLSHRHFDVVMADINMPGMNGIELTRNIVALHPRTTVLALTMHDDSTLINRMIEAGASGYILKSTGIDELLEAITSVAGGEKFLSRDVQKIIMQRIYNANDAIAGIKPDVVRLTARESEILQLIAREFSNEQIAEKLFISERTVETHRKNIFIKTGTRTLVGLIKYAIENDLITPPGS
ncbi:MAG: response regulator transcription factor [Bacteroidales bacterium]|nr:response regulator transcription factor [Bacteroidales bacterium]MDD3664042.1 response regulator transcription factor [Bacteroidales bacterium]